MKYISILLVGLIISSLSSAQSLSDLDSYSVDEFYKKVDLEYGTLDEDGRTIDFIFIKSELDEGTYEISLTDGPDDLYEVRGSDIFIEFNGYFGYAGYSTDCILVVSSYYSATVYKLEDY
jgi:hypothetical protein